MPMPQIPVFLTVAMALTPLGPSQQARLAAWLNWGVAYRDCFEPAPFSLRVDEAFTARCIQDALRRRRGDSPEQQAATDALIAATPQLIAMLNAPAPETGKTAKSGGGNARRLAPPSPPAYR
jgi:hypothetical protein